MCVGWTLFRSENSAFVYDQSSNKVTEMPVDDMCVAWSYNDAVSEERLTSCKNTDLSDCISNPVGCVDLYKKKFPAPL